MSTGPRFFWMLLLALAVSCGAPPARQRAVAEQKAVGVEPQKAAAEAPKDEGQPQGHLQGLEPPAGPQLIPGKVVDGDGQGERRGEHHDAAEQTAERGAFWDAKATDYLVGLSTLLLVFVTGLLWRATRDLVVGAEKNAARQLRAYVGIKDVRVAGRENDQGGATKLAISIRNFGQVPAQAVSIALAWTDLRKGYGIKPETIARYDQTAFTLMPGEVEEIGRMHTTQIVLTDSVVVGRIEYEDGFGKKRFTNLRLLSRMGSDRFARDSYGNDSS